MSPCSRSLSLGTCLALAACFNPTGQTTAASGDSSSDASAGTSAGTDPGTGSGTTAASETTGTPTTGTATASGPTGGPCGACAAPTPYCAPSGDCVGCVDLPASGSSCAAVAPDTPHCDAEAGTCVACLVSPDCNGNGVCHPEHKACVGCVTAGDCPSPLTCDENTFTCVECAQNSDCTEVKDKPICDAGTCRPCREHSDCPLTACELDYGSCFPEAPTRHLYVDAAAEPCQDSNCSPDVPCCSIADAFAEIEQDGLVWYVVHVAAGEYKTPFGLRAGGRRVAVLGGPGVDLDATPLDTPLVWLGDLVGMQPIDSKLYLAGLRITGQAAIAFQCSDAVYAALDDVTIHDVSGDAAHVSQCETKVRRSEFLRNGGGLSVQQAGVLELENSIISGAAVQPALTVTANGQLEVVYSTIVLHNLLAAGLLYCDGGFAGVRNSALLAQAGGDFVDCAALSIANSATTEVDLQGPTVIPVGPPLVKEPFIDWDTHNLRLKGDGNFLVGVALWTSGDPPTDIDGVARPTVDGTSDVAGAALPKRP